MGKVPDRYLIIETINRLTHGGHMVTIGNIAESLGVSLSQAHLMMGSCVGKEHRGISTQYIDCESGVYVVKEA